MSTHGSVVSAAHAAARSSARDTVPPAESELPGQQSYPLRSTYVLARLARVVQRELEKTLERHELTLAQFTTLTVLLRRPGLSNAQLARRALIAPQSMQEVLRTLENRQLVRRASSPTNQRVLETYLTAAGKRLVTRAERDAEAVENAMLAGLTAPQRKQFAKSLQRCVAALDGGLTHPALSPRSRRQRG